MRIYVRDTPAWCALSFHAQALHVLLMRKVDRDGRLPLGRLGRKGVAVLLAQVALWESLLAPALAELEADGCVVIEGAGDATVLLVPGFRDAQEATASGAARTRKWRDSKAPVTSGDASSLPGDATSRGGDECDPMPCRAVPCRAVPNDSAPSADAAAPAPPSAPPPAKATKATPSKPADPRHKPLTDGLLADYADARGAAYCHAGPKDAKAVTHLLALGTQAAGHDGAAGEVRLRWRRALALGEKWPGCASLALLPARWNEIGPGPAATPAGPRVGDLGAVHDDWWRRLAPADLNAFLAERVRLDPILDADAPYTATGIADVDGVTALIGRYRMRAHVARREARP